MSGPVPGRSAVARLVLAILGIGLLVFAGRHFAAELPTIPARIERLGFWGPAVFAAVYALATVAFVPGALLTLAAGAVFGLAVGVAVVLAGATAGASLAFLIARYAARGAVERSLKGNTRFTAIDRAVGRDGRRITFLLRLSPLFPFNLLNYALGLTTVRFADFLVASVGMLPGTLLYVYSGKVAGEVALAAGGVGPPRGPGYYGVLGLGLAATIGVTILITRTARRALREAVE